MFSQVYKSIFTSPSSAKNTLDEENDAENVAPTKSQKISSNNSVRRNVASKLHLNDKVTPRSVAYAAIQVCIFVMVSYVVQDLSMTASSISTCKLRVLGLWFMVDLTTMDYITMSSISLRIPQGLLLSIMSLISFVIMFVMFYFLLIVLLHNHGSKGSDMSVYKSQLCIEVET